MTEGSEEHNILGVHHRGILGGFSYACSCGKTVIDPEGDNKAWREHAEGVPDE